MTDTTIVSANRVEQWDDEFFGEYVRENQFAGETGTGMNNVIQVKEDLTKKKGTTITIPFVTRLTGGVAGNAVLEGAEEHLDNYGFGIPVDTVRNGVIVSELEEQASPFEVRDAGREMLKFWAMETLRGGGSTDETSTSATLGKFGIIDNLLSVYDGTTYSMYRDAAEATKDTWLVNNTDRVLAGAIVANTVSGDHSTSLATIDSAADKLTATTLSLAKRLAKKADSRIRPVKTKGQEEWFIYYAHSLAFADLKGDTTIAGANREAWIRYNGGMDGGSNPLFRDSDLVYDGVVIKEVVEMPYISNAGASSSDVAPGFLCGAQAVGLAWAKRTKSTINQEGGSDYGYRFGVGIRDIRGVRKLYANNKQWGVFTHYSYGQA